MQSNRTPVFREVVLAGDGHAHVLLIRQWGMQPVLGAGAGKTKSTDASWRNSGIWIAVRHSRHGSDCAVGRAIQQAFFPAIAA
jgi:hypothetical protein